MGNEEKRAIAERDISQAGAKRDGCCLYHAFCIACWRQSHGKKRCKIQWHCKSSFALREYITHSGVSLTKWKTTFEIIQRAKFAQLSMAFVYGFVVKC